MFNLERSIVEWRRQMLAAGIKAPAPLEELECHLRDEIERQMKSGLGEQIIFEVAVQKIGKARALKTEFKKASEPKMNRIKLKSVGNILVVATIVVGMLLQIFTDDFISVHRNGIHGAIIFHWTVFLVIALNLLGLVCLAWARQSPSKNGKAT